jgi:DNA-binding CsgD family transcriptional regulator
MVRDRIEVRLDRVETAYPGARRVLEALAPATRPLPHEVVAAVCGGDRRGLRRTLATLRDAAVLTEVGGAWAFRHEILRSALLDAMIVADRRDAHRRLAETLATRTASAAEVAMHFAEAGDPRGADWAVRAGRDARKVDAHSEAIAQFRRALAFELSPEQRRSVLEQAATEAYALGLHEENRSLAEEVLAISGGEPEERAWLHQLAARAAHALGDHAADAAHLDAAEALLAGRPVGMQAAQSALARVSRAALAIAPERLAAAAERALRLAPQLPEPAQAAWVTAQVNRYLAVSQIESGDPDGFALIEAVLETITQHRLAPLLRANAPNGAYAEAVFGLFHSRTDDLRERLFETLRRHDIGWAALNEPYCVLELVQRGRYKEAEARAEALAEPVPVAIVDAVRVFALVLLATRAGSLDHAERLLAGAQPGENFQERTQLDLARLELAVLTADPRLGELAQGVYGAANRRHYARVCAVAAVALARSGRGAPPVPSWLVADSPLCVFWDWAEGLDRRDATALREVAARLDAMECPYEAAMALRDAGDSAECYRRLRALESTTLRGQVAGELRRARQPIPRRTRSALDRDGLTETERHVCRLVANADSNEQIAAALGISLRTVSTHLTRIYAKTGARGRTALALWWSNRSSGNI